MQIYLGTKTVIFFSDLHQGWGYNYFFSQILSIIRKKSIIIVQKGGWGDISNNQIYGEDFAQFCGHLRRYELNIHTLLDLIGI